ncbi:conserved hypothetical protein (DUF4249) [Formosa agariphila KMM 3901]|uniref:Lipoprotein n=1 Tax=Formosa agariphila (strain DSM 15362 / KCTC 12365 / LMG 23005 / KMM 3901 / M-2Alg 35-1) TaxID=1347342 RepID=T2KRW5_FORAG|nr:DUF4249 domain-containing protein [Formosa agariphila]CDF81241.1 conserved hypothetical protein (DUF4249) [Formosa agariphila KMM 3901]
MKNSIYIGLLALTCIITSCTDVIDVEVPTAEPRLVIEASLDWEKGTSGLNQTIKLSSTTPYFETDLPNAVTGAQVSVTRESDNVVFVFEDQQNGTYTTNDFGAILNDVYTLNVIYEGETFTATETLRPTTSITKVTQTRDGGFDPDALEVNVYFDDPEDETNYYVLKYQEIGDYFPDLVTVSDEFLNGNEIHLIYEKRGDDDEDEFQAGDVVNINIYNVTKEYYNYIGILNNQSGSSGNPFTPAPVELLGNCINITNKENYPYGYFRVTQTDKKTYTFVEE